MIRFSEVQAAIFDLDDTLLSNGPADKPEEWLHSRSRLAAVHEVGERYRNQALLNFTAQENARAFTGAAVHSIEGAIWNILFMTGLVASNEPSVDSPLRDLVAEIAAAKIRLHEQILLQYGEEVPGASEFVKRLALGGLAQRLALATSAVQRDIDIFFDKYQLHDYFPPERVIAADKITKPKPDRQAYDLAFQSLGLPESARRTVLAFEDHPRGIVSAKSAGLYVCAIATMFKADDPQLSAAEPDLIASSYAEFSQLLQIP